jgi:hypothetical protein
VTVGGVVVPAGVHQPQLAGVGDLAVVVGLPGLGDLGTSPE